MRAQNLRQGNIERSAALITAKRLQYWRMEQPLFNNFNFSLASGELLLLSGCNGSGKTTLLRIVAGLLPIKSGQLEINTSSLCYLGHNDGVKLELSPIENCQLMLNLSRESALCTIAQALARLGLTKLADDPCYTLSAGQKRRVALARLLLIPAKIWLLDEPLAALDVQGKDLLEQLLADHIAKHGSAIMSAHQTINIPGVMTRCLQL